MKQNSIFQNPLSLTPLKLLFIFMLVSMPFGCSESDESTEPTDEQTLAYNGEIVLPNNSNIDVSTLSVTSSTAQGQNNGGMVEVEELDDYSSLYLTNQNDEVMLMHYKYPGNPDGNINATTTALGLVMMTPSLVFLSDEGKQNLINTLLPSAEFQTLVNKIEENFVNNRSLFDPTNTSLMEGLTDLFQSISQRSANSDEAPVNVFQAGRDFIFNAGEGTVPNVFTTVIGVYQDEQRIDKIVVKGVKLVPNSVSDILSGNGTTFDDPIDYNYSLDGDGEFTFKYRTGKPGFGDGSVEHDEAFYENLSQFSINLFQTFLPTLSSGASTSNCLTTVFNNTYNTISSISNISSNSNAGIGTILYTVNEILLNNIYSLLDNCTEVPAQQGWFSSFINQWNFINTAFDVISNGANTTIFATQWGLSNAVYDECYSANGNDVQECEGFDLEGLWNIEYLTNPPCNATLASTANVAFNNRELNFISTTDTTGNVERDFYIGGDYNEALNVSTYEFDLTTNELNLVMESSGLQFGTDTLERNFYFNGTYDETTGEFNGDFTYNQTLVAEVGGITTTSSKNCNGTLRLFR